MQEFKQRAIMRAGQAAIMATSALSFPVRAANGDCDPLAKDAIGKGAECAAPKGAETSLFGDGSFFQNITNTLIFIVGAVAVLMLIVGGLRYVLSGGNSSNVESAKNTIFYAIIGIVVAILAYAIVNFVIGSLDN